MKVLFCHDGPLRIDEEKNYYGIAFNNDSLSRYFDLANEIVMLVRVSSIQQIGDKTKLSKITLSSFSVICVPDFKKGSYFSNFVHAKKIIEKEVFASDIIVSRLPSSIGAIAAKYAKKYKKPYLIEVVGCPWEGLWNHSFKGKLIAPFSWYHTRILIKSAPYVLYVTQHFLQNRYPSNGKKEACSNVSLPDIDQSALNKRFKKIQANARKPLRLATIAALNIPYKGQQYVIKTLSKLKKEGYLFEYHLVGVGDDSYLRSVAEKYGVSDQVKFIGGLQHKEIPLFLDNIDIYIQPSKTEGLPRALIEAMSRGCPCLGSAIGGIPELLDTAFLFRKGSVNDISRILMSFSQEVMLRAAYKNFNKAKEFEKALLEKRRRNFFLDFKKTFYLD